MTGRMPEYMSDEMSENMSDRMPDRLPDRMPGGMSGYMPDRMPEYMPDRMSDRMSEYTKYMSKYTSWHVMVGITRSRVISFRVLEAGAPHVQEIIMFFVQVARWYFVPTLYHTEIGLTLWNRLKTIFRKLCPNVPNILKPPVLYQLLTFSQFHIISPHSGSPQWPAMDCHRPLDFCCAARAPGAPATPGGCGPAAVAATPRGRRCRRGPCARRGAAAPGAGPNRADAAGIPCHGSWEPLEMETNDPGTWGIWINNISIYLYIYIYLENQNQQKS